MNLQQCYSALGGDYENVLKRLASERLVRKFVLRFPEDKSYKLLEESLRDNNIEEAFRAAHTIKGVCSNLSFDKLLQSAENITEALRSGDIDTAKTLFPAVADDYQLTVSAINSLNE